jgi:hypothetical protein
MVEPSQALAELMRQHELRHAKIDRCEQLADLVDRGRGDIGALVRQVAGLRAVFEAHNDFLRTGVRVDCTGLEHGLLRHRLDGPTGELREALSQLRAHLTGEERSVLSTRR